MVMQGGLPQKRPQWAPTKDIDLLIDAAPENVARVRAALRILEDDAVSERSATTTSPVTR